MGLRVLLSVCLSCLIFSSCITYGAFNIPLKGDSPAGLIWVGGNLEVLSIDGKDFQSHLNAPWYARLGITYASSEFFVSPGVREFVVGYRLRQFRLGRLPLDFRSRTRYRIKFEVQADSITCLCAETLDNSDPENVRFLPDARRYSFPEDFIPEDVIYVEGLTKLLPPEECWEKAIHGEVVAQGVAL